MSSHQRTSCAESSSSTRAGYLRLVRSHSRQHHWLAAQLAGQPAAKPRAGVAASGNGQLGCSADWEGNDPE